MLKSDIKFTGVKDLKLQKIRMHFDERMLNSIIAFVFKDSKLRTRKTLVNIKNLFTNLDDTIFDDKPNLQDKIWIIRKTTEAILVKDFHSIDMIKLYCIEDPKCDSQRKQFVEDISVLKISYDESKFIIKQIEDRVTFGYVISLKEVMQKIFNSIDIDEFRSYEDIDEVLYDVAVSIVNNKRAVNDLYSDDTLSLLDGEFEDGIDKAMQKLTDKNRLFLTGIKRLNTILGGGYMSTRLYTYLAFPGGGKSQMLLKSALDIKKYNPHVETKDPDKIPTIIYLTMENDVTETVERIFNMCGINDDIRNYTTKQVVRMLRRDGGLSVTADNRINITVMFRPNRSIDTNDLYTIIKDLEDRGHECIALILDYMKRIRPAEKALSEKEELKHITNELKTLANHFDIPVITAQQLNRTSASVVDAAIQAKKEDVTRLVGRDGIAGAWEIIENCDVVIIINQERKSDTEELFLTFKMLKRRYRSAETSEKLRRLDYFNHPYDPDNSICLMDDLLQPKSLSLTSLSTTFTAIDTSRSKRQRVEPNDFSQKPMSVIPDQTYETFDMDKQTCF